MQTAAGTIAGGRVAIDAWWFADVARFLGTDPQDIARRLAFEGQKRHRQNEAQQLRAWTGQCVILAEALAAMPHSAGWTLLLEVSLPRMGRRADAVLLTGGAIVVLEFKIGADRFDNAARAQAEDFALDLWDFHAGSRGYRIVPVLVASLARRRAYVAPLPIVSVAQVIDATPDSLRDVLAECGAGMPIDAMQWRAAPYCPVPSIIDAAQRLYARHDVEDIVDAKAGGANLQITGAAIGEALEHAREAGERVIVFVTGVPGAGKTLCGLNACFGAASDTRRATFLTGNPSLVHVLREALVRDAVRRGIGAAAARQHMTGVIQALPAFRDKYAAHVSEVPAEHVVVIDEAQRSWSGEYAMRKSRDRAVVLSASEPAHLLEAMSRHADWAAIVCLIGQGQEIHSGEGGLAEWGAALAGAHAGWRAIAAPDCTTAADARQRLPNLVNLRVDPRLHLSVPTRQIGCPTASDWVDAVLRGDGDRAQQIACDDVPFFLTRDLRALRAGLRAMARGSRRAGLIASSGARRLRAEGLGAEVPHMDANAIARWFLDRFPGDVRASDALETVATEFSVQGLELDVAGLCWDADLIRVSGHTAWRARAFRGSDWQNTGAAEAVSNRINTYRVLLTRARHETIIWVPRGDAADRTRDPTVYDRIADFLACSGARPLPEFSLADPPIADADLFA